MKEASVQITGSTAMAFRIAELEAALRVRQEQELALLALRAWLDEPDLENELRLRKAAKAYLGRK
jgi:hypothetical protein